MIAECLDKSGILKAQRRHEGVEIKRKIQEVVNRISIWPAPNDPGFDGIRAICRVLATATISEHIVLGVRTRLSQQRSDLPAADLNNMITGLVETCKDIAELGHVEVLSEPFLIPVSGEGWLDLCPQLVVLEVQWRSLIKPGTSFDEICTALSAAADAGKLADAEYLDKIIPMTRYYFPAGEWKPLAESIETRLQLSAGCASSEVNQLLHTLYSLLSDGCTAARPVLENLSRGGHIMHYLNQAHADGDQTCKATCVVAFLEYRPDASPNPTGVGQFAAGQRTLVALLSQDDKHLAAEMSAFMRVIKHTDLVLEVIAARKSFEPLTIECLRFAADATWSAELFTPQVVLDWWHQLQEHLDEGDSSGRFSQLIARASETQEFVPFIQAAQFRQENAGLYLAICRASPNEVFRDWCCRGL